MGKGKENTVKAKPKAAKAAAVLPGVAAGKVGKGKPPSPPGKASKAPASSKRSPATKPAPKAKSTRADDQFAFTEVVETSEISSLTKKLKASTGKDALVRTLKRLAEVLESAPQDAAQLGTHGSTMANALLELASEASADKDIKLYCVQCMVFVLRMYAPETPYDDEQLKVFFQLLRWALDRLSQPNLPTFLTVLSVLHVTSETRLFTVMLDLDDPQLVDNWVATLLGVIRSDNLEAVEKDAHQVLCGLLEEGGPEVVSEALLISLLKAVAGLAPGGAVAQRLAARVMRRCEEALRSKAQALLTELVEGSKAGMGGLKQHVAELLVKVQGCTPSILLPVFPLLKLQMEASDPETRRAAAVLVTHLMTSHDCHGSVQDLTLVYLERYMDVAVEVRLQMLEATKLLAVDGMAIVQEQAVQLTADRLTDRDDKVRMAAARALCDVATTPGKIDAMPSPVMERLMARLMDKVPAVRKEVATGLVDVFRALATLVAAAGAVPDTVPTCLMTIPACLAQAAMRDTHLRVVCHQLLASPGLMPASGPAASSVGQATVWALCWAETDDPGRLALLRLLAIKTDLSLRVLAVLSLRKQIKGASPTQATQATPAADDTSPPPAAAAATAPPPPVRDVESLKQRMSRYVEDIVEQVLGPAVHGDKADSHAKCRTSLQSLLEFKDAKVAERLVTLCNPNTPAADARSARKDVVERVGTKTALGSFVQLLTAAVLPTLISPSTFQALASLVLPTHGQSPGAARDENEDGHDEGMTSPSARLAGSSGFRTSSGGLSGSPQVLGAAADILCRCSKDAAPLLTSLTPYVANAVLSLCWASKLGGEPEQNGGLQAIEGNKAGKRRLRNGKVDIKSEPASDDSRDADFSLVDVSRLRVALCVLAHVTERQTGKPLPLPVGFYQCAHTMALYGPPKIAALAAKVYAQTGQAGNTTRQGTPPASLAETVAGLASDAALHMTLDNVEKPAGVAAVHVLSTVGLMAPSAFGDHAVELVNYLINHLLRCNNPGGVLNPTPPRTSPPSSDAPPPPPLSAPSKQYQGVAPPGGNSVAAAKGAMLRAVAKACAPPPQFGSVHSATNAAVNTLVPVLEDLVDVDTTLTDELGVRGDENAAAIRLASARALLRLCTRHDTRLPTSSYVALALVIQDPSAAVRACFGAKLCTHVTRLQLAVTAGHSSGSSSNKGSAGDWLPTKYAAILPLAAVEPLAPLRASAAQHLKAYCATKRISAQKAAQQAAMAGDGGADGVVKGGVGVGSSGMLQALPEFILPYLVFLLAAHPDCPDVPISSLPALNAGSTGAVSEDVPPQDPQEEDPQGEEAMEELYESLQPFGRMLQMLLEPLLLLPAVWSQLMLTGRGGRGTGGKGAVAQSAMTNYPLVAKVLHHTKVTQMVDPQTGAVSPASTTRMRTMCDLAMDVTSLIVSRECEAAGLPSPPSISTGDHPATVMLPKMLYDCTSTTTTKLRPKLRAGDHLPRGFQVTLDKGVTKVLGLHANLEAQPTGQARKRKAGKHPAGAAAGSKKENKPPRRRPRQAASDDEDEEDEESDPIDDISSADEHDEQDEQEDVGTKQVDGRSKRSTGDRSKAAVKPKASLKSKVPAAGKSKAAVKVATRAGQEALDGSDQEDEEE